MGEMMKTESWDEIWLRKGNSESNNLQELDGYEKTQVDMDYITSTIIQALSIENGHRVLEVGCGAGALAEGLQKKLPGITYVGTERSASLVRKHIKILKNSVLNFSADDLVFADQFFDHCICFGVFEYFKDFDYAKKAVNAFARQARNIFIGDITRESHSPYHLLFDEKAADYIISDLDLSLYTKEVTRGLYEPHSKSRFNISLVRK